MVNNMAARGRMKLTVHLDDNGRISEVFVSPTTKCKDIVLRLQRQIRKNKCCLVEVWQGCERLVPEDELIQSTLLEWDSDLDEVVFYLRPYEETVSPHLLDSVTDGIQIIEEEIPQNSGSALVVTRNGLRENHGTSGFHGNSRLSVEELQQLAARQQQEIELKEQKLAEKEQQLKEIKQRTRHKIRSTYIDQLEAQIHEQDMKMKELREIQDDIETYRLSNSALDDELQSLEAQFSNKEQELVIAAAKVEGLTRQLNEQREKWNNVPKQKEKNKDEIAVDRLREELMTRNELNHQQSVQMQAQKQLLAEKHKELFELDSQIEQLTQELHRKKAGGLHSTPNQTHKNGTTTQNELDENGLWENGESFDWSEFVNTEDTYDEEMHLNYNDSDKNGSGHRPRQNNSRHLETLLEEEEPGSTGTCSKASSLDGSSNSQVDPLSHKQGNKSRVSRLATFFEAEVAAHNELKDPKTIYTKKNVVEKSLNEYKVFPVENKTKHVEALNSRGHDSLQNSYQTGEADKQFDNVFYHRTVASSPLSSPSSLSSLSSFSSTSSASRTTARQDEPRGNPESVLRSRETKTAGLETSSVSTSYDKPRESNDVDRSPAKFKQNLDNSRETNPTEDSGSPFGNVKTSLQQLRSMAISLSDPGRTTGRRSIVSPSPQEAVSLEHASQNDPVSYTTDSQPVASQQTVNFIVKPTGTSFIPQQQDPKSIATPVRKTNSPSVAMVFASPTVRDILAQGGKGGETNSNNQRTSEMNVGNDDDYGGNYSRKVPGIPVRNTTEESQAQKAVNVQNNNMELIPNNGSSQAGAVSKVKITLVSTGTRPTLTTPESLNTNRTDRVGGGDVAPRNVTYTTPSVSRTSINSSKGSCDSITNERIRTARVTAIDTQTPLTVATSTTDRIVDRGSPMLSRSKDEGTMAVTSHHVRTIPTDTLSTRATSITDKTNTESNLDKAKGISVATKETTQKGASGDKKRIRHVILDPHAVLLDAAVEGELEQVKRVIRDVDDPSLANSDGITALHNAVCGNHESVVRFLVEYGCDVNLPDSHGWTPLHCSAANNNFNIIRYLVENGACIFAATGLQKKTPVQCCDKTLPGYKQCVKYLEDIQSNFGLTVEGKVYALYAYNADEKDELSFECGEELHVLRRGDSTEREWWWAKNSSGQTGYIPRNLLGMSPRVAPEV